MFRLVFEISGVALHWLRSCRSGDPLGGSWPAIVPPLFLLSSLCTFVAIQEELRVGLAGGIRAE